MDEAEPQPVTVLSDAERRVVERILASRDEFTVTFSGPERVRSADNAPPLFL